MKINEDELKTKKVELAKDIVDPTLLFEKLFGPEETIKTLERLVKIIKIKNGATI